MKHLFLLRHGNALRGTAEMSDHQRPLSDEGKREAANAGAWLMASGALPDYILCSTAVRAQQTLESLGLPEALVGRVVFSDTLYLASPGEILQNIQSAPEDATRLLLIGHNPGLHDFCTMFTQGGDAVALDTLSLEYKTAALAGLDFAVAHWKDLPGNGGQLAFYREPN